MNMRAIPILLTVLVTMSAHKCSEATAAAAGDGDPVKGAKKIGSVLDQKWVLQTLKGKPVSLPKDVAAPWLKLTKEGSRVEGFGGCNNLFGGFTLEGDRVKLENLASTKKFCEAVQPTENAFMSALKGTDHFKLEGNVLKLLTGTAEAATFRPE